MAVPSRSSSTCFVAGIGSDRRDIEANGRCGAPVGKEHIADDGGALELCKIAGDTGADASSADCNRHALPDMST